MESLQGYIISATGTMLFLLFSALTALALKKLGTERLRRIKKEYEVKTSLAYQAVQFAQQVYWDCGGIGKYNQASKWLSDRLTEKGIKVSQKEIKGLIEAALKGIKDEFGVEWSKVKIE
jgi:LL-H family phage holin